VTSCDKRVVLETRGTQREQFQNPDTLEFTKVIERYSSPFIQWLKKLLKCYMFLTDYFGVK
jgi:hypothetical protein